MLRGISLGLILALAICSDEAKAQIGAAPAQTACELHFWPASSVETYPTPTQAQGGPVWALLLGGAKRADAIQGTRSEIASSLDADGSLLALDKADLSTRLGLQPATLVIHEEPLDDRSLGRIRTRRAASLSPCYSELIVTRILYKNGSFGGRFLESGFMLREFGSGKDPIRITKGGGSIQLNAFPAKEGEDSTAASADLASAFRQAFNNFVAKRRRADP